MTSYRIPASLETAFNADFSYTDESGNKFVFYTYIIGNLKINNGRIVACDPFLYNQDTPFETIFPIGNFPVQLAVAKVGTDERIGFARIEFSDALPVSWEMATWPDQNLSELQENEIFGYGVDAGTGCFMDTSGAEEFYNFLMEQENNYEILIDEMEKTDRPTWSRLLWERNGGNVAMFSSGWGDGYYASYIGFDAHAKICRLVTDFGVID